MKRWGYFRLGFVAIICAAAIVGCGGVGGLRPPLPTSVGNLAQTRPPDQEQALEQAVVRAYGKRASVNGYGVIDGGWYEPPEIPGRPGYYLIDGDVVKGPPDDSPPRTNAAPQAATEGVPAPLATENCDTFAGAVPPPCTDTGPFRRVYSDTGYSYALARLVLPAHITTMPTGAPWPGGAHPTPTPLNGDTGYVYFEGWYKGNVNAGNSEFGLQYSAKNNWYSPYYKTYGPNKTELHWQLNHWLPSTAITFAIAGYTLDKAQYLHVALIGTTTEACKPDVITSPENPHLCLAHDHALDPGWSSSACCILARMTTIGQTLPNKFYDGVSFGPISWNDVELAKNAPTPAPGSTTLPLTGGQPAWQGGGSQNWPPQLDKIVVAGESADAETDTVDLAKLPDLKLSVSPSKCQHFALSGSVKYAAAISGAQGALKGRLAYGWHPGVLGAPAKGTTYTMDVPGAKATGDPNTGITYIGADSTKATVSVSVDNKLDDYEVPTGVSLYYIDATGTLTPDWNGSSVETYGGSITLANTSCPK